MNQKTISGGSSQVDDTARVTVFTGAGETIPIGWSYINYAIQSSNELEAKRDTNKVVRIDELGTYLFEMSLVVKDTGSSDANFGVRVAVDDSNTFPAPITSPARNYNANNNDYSMVHFTQLVPVTSVPKYIGIECLANSNDHDLQSDYTTKVTKIS
jgi:hypothetical protein